MPTESTPRAPEGRLRPAWWGIAGWVLFLAAWVVAATTPYPHNGQAIVALALGILGMGLVRRQTAGGAR